jgi:hypothetical protein
LQFGKIIGCQYFFNGAELIREKQQILSLMNLGEEKDE